MFLPHTGPHIFSLLLVIFWVWMLIDCIRNTTLRHKVLWVLFILFTHALGAFVYFFARGPWQKVYQSSQRPAPIYQPPPPVPQPIPETYAEYEQGYQAQQEHPAPTSQAEQPWYSPPALQPQYEEPQVAYPEEPPPQQY
jgi:phospholipase D-like protein